MAESTGWVIFPTQGDFDTKHQQAKDALGIPLTGKKYGEDNLSAPQAENITVCYPHPTDLTVCAWINGGWPENLKTGMVFLDRSAVSAYLPTQEP